LKHSSEDPSVAVERGVHYEYGTLAYLEVIQSVHSHIINRSLIISNKFTKFIHDKRLEAEFHHPKRTLVSKKIKEEEYNKCM
jgi:hypothetical protein